MSKTNKYLENLVVIKLGGSYITDKKKPLTPRPSNISTAAQQIHQVIESCPGSHLVIGNGAGSYGHYLAKKHAIKQGIQSDDQRFGFCEVQDSVAQLNRLVVQELLKAHVPACSLPPSSWLTAENGQKKSVFLDSFTELMKNDIVPVVFGDIVSDTEKGCSIFSTEHVFAILAEELKQKGGKVDKLVYITDVEGVLDTNGDIIPVITHDTREDVAQQLYANDTFDVTGGMMHKIDSALEYAQNGTEVFIMRPSEENRVSNAIRGEPVKGTVFKRLD